MATATPTTEPVVFGVALEISKGEAEALRTLLAWVGGYGEKRTAISNISQALDDAGFFASLYDGMHTEGESLVFNGECADTNTPPWAAADPFPKQAVARDDLFDTLRRVDAADARSY